jgi:RNA polymerase sigma-70 factor (ECF subfamily)
MQQPEIFLKACIQADSGGVFITWRFTALARIRLTGLHRLPGGVGRVRGAFVSADGNDYAQLLAACGRGDRSALRAIYDGEAGKMIGVAMRILKRKELAEEIVHDAFVQIWRFSSRYDPELGSARAWMFAIVRNRAINALRDGARETSASDDEIHSAMDREGGTENAFDRLAEGSALRRCLEQLDAKRRIAVLLAYVEGLSHGEIAARLNVPLGTCKSWITRSLVQLRECLA